VNNLFPVINTQRLDIGLSCRLVLNNRKKQENAHKKVLIEPTYLCRIPEDFIRRQSGADMKPCNTLDFENCNSRKYGQKKEDADLPSGDLLKLYIMVIQRIRTPASLNGMYPQCRADVAYAEPAAISQNNSHFRSDNKER